MNPLNSIANRHLLASSLALGAVSVLLCAIMLLRENANRTRLAALSDEMAYAKTTLKRALDQLAEATHRQNSQATTALEQTARKLEDALAKTNTKLDEYADTVEEYRVKQPWLIDSRKSKPWTPRLDELRTELNQLQEQIKPLSKRLDQLEKP